MNQNDEFSETGQYLGTMPTRAEAEALDPGFGQPCLTRECVEAGTDWPPRNVQDENERLRKAIFGEADPHGRIAEMNAHLEQARQKMGVVYISPSGDEAYQWYREGCCIWCGGKCPGDKCYLRNCTSCSQYWLADTLADVDEGHLLTHEYCPTCQIWLDSFHAVDPARPDHVLCGSVIDPEVKTAGERWKGWVIWTTLNRRDFEVTADSWEEAVEKMMALARAVLPNPLFQDLTRAGIAKVTCAECLPIWNNLHLTYKPALAPAEASK